MRLSSAVETYTQLKLAGSETAIALLERYLAMRGAGAGKTMFTFGVTGSRAQCKSALQLALRMSRKYGGVSTGTLLGKKWEHGRFRSPCLRHGLWDSGFAVDTMETAVDWARVPEAAAGIESAIAGALAEQGIRARLHPPVPYVRQGSSIYTTYIFRCGSSYQESTVALGTTEGGRAERLSGTAALSVTSTV